MALSSEEDRATATDDTYRKLRDILAIKYTRPRRRFLQQLAFLRRRWSS